MPARTTSTLRHVAHDRVAQHDVLLEHAVLVGGQLRGLAQHDVRDADLADVVEQAGEVDRPAELLVEAEALGQEDGVARHVLRVTLRVSVLVVDRDDQALEHVEAAGQHALLLADLGDAHGVAAAPLRLADRDRGHREQLGDRCGVLRIGADAGADADRQALGVTELHADLLEAGPQAFHGRLHGRHVGAGAHQQELVGAVAGHVPVARLERHELGHAQQHLVGRLVAVGVVEEPEVVDVDQRDADAAVVQARGLHRLGEQRDDGAVVEHLGQRVAAGRLDQLLVLPAEARLGRPEDEEEHGRQQQAGGEGDDHDVPPGGVQARQQRRRIAPHRHHRDRLVAALDDGEVLLEDARGVERADRFDLAGRLDDGRARIALRAPLPCRRTVEPPRPPRQPTSLASTRPSRPRISMCRISSLPVRLASRPPSTAARAGLGPSSSRSVARRLPFTNSSTSDASRLTTPFSVELVR